MAGASATRPDPGIVIGAAASVSAALIHALAASAHRDHPSLSRLFIALALAQAAAGVLALLRVRGATGVLISVNAVAAVGWAVTRVVEVSVIDGLVRESPGVPDTIAAVLAAIAVAAPLLPKDGLVPLVTRNIGLAYVPVLIAANIVALDATTQHAHGEEHGHDDLELASEHAADHAEADTDHVADHESLAWDPAKPIDLSGTPGVTIDQQAWAENLVADTVRNLPQWADHRDAEAAGFRTTGDAFTGFEHFVQWAWINDDVQWSPDQPESLVYTPQPDGSKKLVAAMYMLPNTVDIDSAPKPAGELMQYHQHDDLCYTLDDPPQLAAQVLEDGSCPPGTRSLGPPAIMAHVWVVPNECGPFASIEGSAGGQVPEGEERLCDHLHGSR